MVWERSFANIQMLLASIPQYGKGKEKEEDIELDDQDDIRKIFGQ